MDAETPTMRHIRLPHQRLRKMADSLLELRGSNADGTRQQRKHVKMPPIRVVCISDTHNLRPTLPPGDLLLHAGDLTEWGSFDEIQTQLTWLSSQPHRYKVLIAGNHDVLLDEEFLAQQPRHQDSLGRTRRDLDFGSVIYLQDESVTLSFAGGARTLNVYGSPRTPHYGTSAFQYPRDKNVWSKRVPSSTDVLITHGPPARFNGIKQSAGCPYLRHEVSRVKPDLMVFGHIHFARGEQTVTFDAVQLLHDDIMDDLRGWEAVPFMAIAVVWSRLRKLVDRPVKSTRMINAAVVDGMRKDVALKPFAFDV